MTRTNSKVQKKKLEIKKKSKTYKVFDAVFLIGCDDANKLQSPKKKNLK
jgi:hypothetical protein